MQSRKWIISGCARVFGSVEIKKKEKGSVENDKKNNVSSPDEKMFNLGKWR